MSLGSLEASVEKTKEQLKPSRASGVDHAKAKVQALEEVTRSRQARAASTAR